MNGIKIIADERVPRGEAWAVMPVHNAFVIGWDAERRVYRVEVVTSYKRVASIVNIGRAPLSSGETR